MNSEQNNTIESIHFDNQFFTKLLINICTLLNASFAIIVSLFIIAYVLVIYYSRSRSKNSFNVSLLLTCNTSLAIICSSIIIILIQLSNIGGDRDVKSLKWIISWGCYIRGYLLFLFINSVYLSYLLQAGYRLFRVVFHDNRCLRSFSTFFYYILGQWILAFIVLIPILFTGKNFTTAIVYLPEDFYCQVPVTNMHMIAYAVLVVYVSPLSCMGTIYFWIIIYIRRNIRYRRKFTYALKLQRKSKRDSIIIKRICLVMLLLVTLGVPAVIFFILFIISGHLHWAFYRLSWMSIAIAYALICLSSIYVTPEIYRPIKILLRYSQRRRASSVDHSSTSNITKTQTKNEHGILRKILSDNMVELDLIERRISVV